MTNINLWKVEVFPWEIFALYWCVSAFQVKSTKATEPLAARLYTLCLTGAAFFLLFTDAVRSTPLGRRFIAGSAWQEWTAVALTYAGVTLAIWARWNLGQNWSARVGLKVGHELIRSGPYARLRHPIYSGMLLAAIGTALFIGEWRGLLAVLIVAVVHSLKAKREEALMLATFGDQYRQYRHETGFLLPKL